MLKYLGVIAARRRPRAISARLNGWHGCHVSGYGFRYDWRVVRTRADGEVTLGSIGTPGLMVSFIEMGCCLRICLLTSLVIGSVEHTEATILQFITGHRGTIRELCNFINRDAD
jgi:hypothetical protein